MTLQQLNYFCAICKEMHYTKAANKIHVSQPSLSYAIRELEQELGVSLFRKKRKQMELTECGEIFYQYVQKSLQRLEEGVQAVQAKKEEGFNQINIGYLFSISVDFLAPMIGKYYDYIGRHDQIMNFMPYKQPQLVSALQMGKIDVAFATDDVKSELADTAIEMLTVCQQELYVVVRKDHPLSQRKSVLFANIKDENFVAINPGKGLRMQMDLYFKKMKVQPRIVFSVNETETLIDYVEAGVGIAIMPRIPTMNFEKITLLPVSDCPIRRGIVMLINSRRDYNNETKSLIDFVRTRKFKL